MPGKHIHNLLNTHGRVIVPELGAFILKGKSIYFNEFLRFNDGVLVDYMAEKEKINKEEATKKIAEFVVKVHKQLSTSKSVELDGLGILVVDSNDKIQLKPLDAKSEPVPVKDERDAGPREVYFEIEKNDNDTPAKPVVKSTKKSKSTVSKNESEAEIPKQQEKVETPIEIEKEGTPIEIEIEKSAKPTEEVKTTPSTNIPEEIKTVAEVKEDIQPQFQPVQQTAPIEIAPTPSVKSSNTLPPQSSHTQSQAQAQYQSQSQSSRKPTPQKQVITHKTRGGGKIWIGILIAVALGVAGYFIFLHDLFKESNVNQNIIIGGKNLNDSAIGADLKQEITESPNEPATTNETGKSEVASAKPTNVNITDDSKSIPLTKASNGKKYYLIAGCFSIEANADKMVHKLITDGYPAEKFVRSNNNLYYVSYSSHTDRKEATQELNRLKAAGQSNVWILGH